MRQILTERRWLEGQGKLDRKDFMLHDREHWPTLSLPGGSHMQQAGVYANQMMQHPLVQNRFPQNPYAHGQPPPAKRPRTSGGLSMPGPSDGLQDTSIEDEENTSLGDFFDHLSPREISMARYMQHHRWMEEVFSSPYASSQIVPPDLGLGLMGELKGLTEGILEQPSLDEVAKPVQRPDKAKEAQPFTNLTKEQVNEFTRRVDKHLENGRAEIERMKREHAEKMAEWKKTKTVMQAEKKLRYATWDGHESAVPAYRLDMPATNGHVDDGVPVKVEDVVKEVEDVLKVKITGHKDATLIEKGGLEKEEEPEPEPEGQMVQEGAMQPAQDVSNIRGQEPMMSGANGSMKQEQPGFNQHLYPTPDTQGQALASSVPPTIPQPTFAGEQPRHAHSESITQVQQSTFDNTEDHHHLDDVEGMGMGDQSYVDDMDMDVDTGEIDFIEHDEASGDEGGVLVEAPEASAGFSGQPEVRPQGTSGVDPTSAATGGLSHTDSPVTFGETGGQQVSTPRQGQQQPPVSTEATEGFVAGESAIDDSTVAQETALADIGEADPGIGGADHDDLFDDGTFDDLGNVDDGAGDDGLIDFDGGGMGMEESAFGDALHGMDTDTPFGHHEQGGGGEDLVPQ